jgi:[ribosomal protein S5]-alanine N-acetyltransferase
MGLVSKGPALGGIFHLYYLHPAMSDVMLRHWRREDAQQLASIANNKNVWLNVRDRFPHPYTVMDAMQWIQMRTGEKPMQHFCITYNENVAGSIGVIVKDDVYRKSIELGYFVGEPFWGKGIATKAVKLMMEYIELTFDVLRVYAEVFEHNKASMGVLRKNGFYLEGIRKKAVIKDEVLMDDYVWVKFINKK